MQSPEGIIEIKLQPFIRGFTKAVKDQSAESAEQAKQLREIISNFDKAIQELSGHLATTLQQGRGDRQQFIDLISRGEQNTNETRRLLAELETKINDLGEAR